VAHVRDAHALQPGAHVLVVNAGVDVRREAWVGVAQHLLSDGQRDARTSCTLSQMGRTRRLSDSTDAEVEQLFGAPETPWEKKLINHLVRDPGTSGSA